MVVVVGDILVEALSGLLKSIADCGRERELDSADGRKLVIDVGGTVVNRAVDQAV